MTIQERVKGLLSSVEKGSVLLAAQLMSTLPAEEAVKIFNEVSTSDLERANMFIRASLSSRRVFLKKREDLLEPWIIIKSKEWALAFVEHSIMYILDISKVNDTLPLKEREIKEVIEL